LDPVGNALDPAEVMVLAPAPRPRPRCTGKRSVLALPGTDEGQPLLAVRPEHPYARLRAAQDAGVCCRPKLRPVLKLLGVAGGQLGPVVDSGMLAGIVAVPPAADPLGVASATPSRQRLVQRENAPAQPRASERFREGRDVLDESSVVRHDCV